MKLLVIVLCLLSERFLVHVSSHNRFHWFSLYSKAMDKQLAKVALFSSPWVMLILALLPMLLGVFIALFLFSSWVFGFIGLLLNIVIFYVCMGPGNPFYPLRTSEKAANEKDIGHYLAQINGQLFAVIFWYIVLGPLAILVYRLLSLSQSQDAVKLQARRVTDILDWLPARMTVVLYLLVGNFQAGFRHLCKLFISPPENNHILLSECGLQAMGNEPPTMSRAESLVEHGLIALLVLLACFTLAAWM